MMRKAIIIAPGRSSQKSNKRNNGIYVRSIPHEGHLRSSERKTLGSSQRVLDTRPKIRSLKNITVLHRSQY